MSRSVFELLSVWVQIGPLSDEEYVRQQRGRSRPGEYKTIRRRTGAAPN